MSYTTIQCNDCGKRLTEKEASVYELQWRLSGDMYCMKHRACPDDCRRTPCSLVFRVNGVIQRSPYTAYTTYYARMTPEEIQAAKDLGREGKYKGYTWRLVYVHSSGWLLQIIREAQK